MAVRVVPHNIIYITVFVGVIIIYWLCYGAPHSSSSSTTVDGTGSSGVSIIASHSNSLSWLYRLVVNLLTYSTVLLPGYLFYRYVTINNLLDESKGNGCFLWLARACFGTPLAAEVDVEGNSSESVGGRPQRTLRQEALLLALCFVGLMGTYLTWGVLQEKVMTQTYKNGEEEENFQDSQFLVFVNRILALVLSGSYLLIRHQPKHNAPLSHYMYSSLSNIMSSWCQYEALKFVSFPTQVLAKASKIIPVMLMGKLVMKQKYEYYEYVTAVLISVGMTFFMLSTAPNREQTVTTLSGMIILAAYMVTDSFTSNWQGALFKRYSMTPVQMMCGVNMFSCLFTAVSLLQQGSFSVSIAFMMKYPKFMIDCLLLSISSGAGQLFIFFTISSFGPVVFVIIMTIRQGVAILVSCLLYSHDLPAMAIMGIVIVFMAVFLRIYCNERLKALRRASVPEPLLPTTSKL